MSSTDGRRLSGGRSHNKWAILFTVLVMTFMVCLDSSIVTVALPVMQKELAAGDQIQWVSSVYLLATCVGTLPFGRLGDVHGKVYVFQAGVVVFTVGSLLCGLAQALPVLVAARVVQGVGCAAAMANNMGIITEAFPSRERGRAMGLLSTFVALGMMAGPVLGGAIVSAFPWEGIFLINVPVGVVSFLVGLRTLPHVRPVPGSPRATSFLGSARACFSSATFVINFATMLIVFMGIGASEFVLPFYFQDAHGFSAQTSSLLFMTLPVVNAFVGPLSGSVADRVGYEPPTCLGLVVYVCGLLLVGTLVEVSPVWRIVAFVALMSLGTSIFQSPNNALFMGAAPEGALGFAGSLSSLARYGGMAIGISGCSRLLYARMSAVAGETVTSYVEGRPDIFLAGFSFVFHVLAGVAAVGLVLTFVRLVRKRR
ncbi:MFS transporter [uncultured Parolsenella sp.]|uniref:MFS transporter n=1 Tax=uncultured Parolsenella sp. TaxID=2083008 RepID=UPI0027D9712E|nr:MFS transporter [uncultured Parolsenella sp.]